MVEQTDPKDAQQDPENNPYSGLNKQVSNVTDGDEALNAELQKLEQELEEGKYSRDNGRSSEHLQFG